MKKYALVSLGSLGAVSAAFAEGSGSGIDLSAATTAMGNFETAISAWVTANAPTLVAILGGVLVISLVFLVYKLIKKATNKAG